MVKMLEKIVEELFKTYWCRLKKQKNVVGFDGQLRPKEINGRKHKNWLTWRVYVDTKLPKAYLSRKDVIPELLNVSSKDYEIFTDVIAIGRPVIPPLLGLQKSTQDQWRPIEAGISSCHKDCTACTLNGFFETLESNIVPAGEFLQASNMHCYGLEGDAKQGDAIIQPSPYDGGDINDKTGEYAFGVPINFETYTCPIRNFITRKLAFWRLFKPSQAMNDVDVSFATVNVDWKNKIARESSGFKGYADPKEGDPVAKCGRTTDRTEGKWGSTSMFINVQYRRGIAFMTDVAMANIECAGGDSGSPMYHPKDFIYNCALFAGSNTGQTFGCKISNILKRAPVKLIVK